MQYLVKGEHLEHRTFGAGGVKATIFNGGGYGLESVSFMIGEVDSGDGVQLHRHEYEEVFIIQEGCGTFTIDSSVVEATAGDIIVIPAGLPHSFKNAGDSKLVQLAIHGSSSVVIEWL